MRRGGGFHRHKFFEKIISLENLFWAWREFKKGKLKKQDIARFAAELEEEVFRLHTELANFSYKHGPYSHFVICDPKRRDVHKALPRDRLLHHAVFRVLEPVFEKGFVHDSFSSRKGKGIHKAHKRFHTLAWKLSRNNTRTVWTLKCDIRKFFNSVDHLILIGILEKKLDRKTMDLLKEIIGSFGKSSGKGIPIGNLTSQLFSNIYLNEFDQFVKRILRTKQYIRYADDFVVLSSEKDYLEKLLPPMKEFLGRRLALSIHSDKTIVRKWTQGSDFLGHIIFPFHTLLRTKTKRRMLRKIALRKKELVAGRISGYSFSQSLQSYLGMLKHCHGRGLHKKIRGILL